MLETQHSPSALCSSQERHWVNLGFSWQKIAPTISVLPSCGKRPVFSTMGYIYYSCCQHWSDLCPRSPALQLSLGICFKAVPEATEARGNILVLCRRLGSVESKRGDKSRLLDPQELLWIWEQVRNRCLASRQLVEGMEVQCCQSWGAFGAAQSHVPTP